MNGPKSTSERMHFGGQQELDWLRRVVDADSARLSALRAENRRLIRLAREVVDTFDRKPTASCVAAVKALAEAL